MANSNKTDENTSSSENLNIEDNNKTTVEKNTSENGEVFKNFVC